MPRKARVLVPNCPHHIVQRGHNRNAVFLSERDYRFYLKNLQEWKNRLEIKVYAWCLMTNHIHLILQPGNDASLVSELMKRVNGRHSAYINKLESRSGSLWEGRFKASPVQENEYLLSCCRYIELNPVNAGMVSRPENYSWSSYQARMRGLDDELLDESHCFRSIASNAADRIAWYQDFVAQRVSHREIELIRNGVKRNQLTGNNRFVGEIERRIGRRI